MANSSQNDALRERMTHSEHSLWLGRLVWYSVSGVEMPHQELGRLMMNSTLRGFIPRPPADIDVFRRVCTKAHRKNVATDDPEVYQNYMVRDVGADSFGLYKVMVRETVDTRGRKLQHDSQLCKITFLKATSTLTVECDGSDVVATQIGSDLQSDYYTKKGTVESYAVRELLRRIVLSCAATQVRPGVYFVAETYGDTIEALEQMAEQMPAGVEVHSLPLVDDRKQREMLRNAFENETAGDVDSLVEEMNAILKLGKKVTSDRAQTYLAALSGLRRKHKEYASLLESSLDVSVGRLDLLQRQVQRLADLVE